MDSDSQQSGFASTQSDDDEEYHQRAQSEERTRKRRRRKVKREENASSAKTASENILLKLRNRQLFGYFSSHPKRRCKEQPFKKVPATLSFCLKDIIPCCYLDGHIFMGLTACGQFLLSYKVHIDDEISATYDFSTVYRYKLFFWIYRPHNPLHKYFSISLFDDHGIDGMKKVSMTQWSTQSAVLVVHGESDNLETDSYVTYVRVPKLGCLDCRELRRDYFDPVMPREAMLCVKCALMIHIKYRGGESSPKFKPEINLNAPGFILMNENTFIHAISVDLDMARQREPIGNGPRYTPFSMICHKSMDCDARSETVSNISENDAAGRRLTIADEIIADFEEFETESMTGKSTQEASPLRTLTEKLQKKSLESLPSSSTVTLEQQSGSSPLKDITSTSPKEKIKLYEFEEENEKCEKISTFRKRRLADKKYEFIEDSFDSILPFNRIRDRIRSRLPAKIGQNSENTASHLHRASPNQGFRSPCGSPVGYRFLRSPPGMRSPNYYTQRSPSYHANSPNFAMNPNLKYFGSPRAHNSRGIFPLRAISSPIHRPYDIENNENQPSLSNLSVRSQNEAKSDEISEPWKNSCSKKFTRRYVEEDDANSVITTTEEDDCISPGYHTSLPLEVHGACYSNMQTVSRATCSQLKNRPVVHVTQNTFDTESFTVNVATFVCKQNNKVYDMLCDSTYAICHVCPISATLTCLMKIEFFANDAPDTEVSRRITSRPKYQLRTLFTWNVADGALNVLDYGKMVQIKGKSPVGTIDVNELTTKLATTQNQVFNHLRVLTADTSKSKQKLVDMQNMIEFYRKNRSNTTDFSSFSDATSFDDESSDEQGSLSD
ncbi:uncharacterized protein LOC134835636 [Culicoides brevitarsis]|uniref:uncharacterized protein LOC134835636 n=1 Tax=Culicoides brevitarsis TaxID=469753 RepID=UPI00307C1C0B